MVARVQICYKHYFRYYCSGSSASDLLALDNTTYVCDCDDYLQWVGMLAYYENHEYCEPASRPLTLPRFC
jgi:hypothetical protein